MSLHLNVLSRMANGTDVDVSIVDKGKGTFCNIGTKKISIEDVSEDVEILIGLGFHELGHALATTAIDYRREENIPEQDVELLHSQLNSFEDYRIENRISYLYPPAEYYLRKMSHWWRMEGAKERRVGEMTENPQFPLHLLLDNLDFTRFLPKECRKEVRAIAKELKEKSFQTYPSTKALFPLAKDAYYRLKPFIPKEAFKHPEMQREMARMVPVVPCKSGGANSAGKQKKGEKALGDIKDGDSLILKETEKPSSGIPQLDLEIDLDLLEKEKENKNPTTLKGCKPPSVKQQQDYVRPHEPNVVKVTAIDKEMVEYGGGEAYIIDEAYCASQGTIIGRKLIQELKLKDGTKRKLDDGELDVDDVIENMQENRGKLGSFDVFSDTTPLIHDHTVCVLIDMSGSMSSDIRIARGAALMLAKALEEMNVPYSLRGFGAVQGKLEIHDLVIKDFDETLDMDKLRVMFMGNVNRDTDSIRNAMNLIRGERGRKIIFVISDGHPNHGDGTHDYRDYNKNAYMDMWFLSREAEKEGISVIGIGISSEAANFIEGTYLKGFWIEDLQVLPEKLLKIYLAETSSLRQTWRKVII